MASGTDWPSVVAAISGGLVGLAGIGATLYQFFKNAADQDSRGRRDDRRRAYAALHASFDKVFGVATAAKLATQDRDERMANLNAVLPDMYNAVSELRLVAPPEIGTKARTVATQLGDRVVWSLHGRQALDEDNAVYNGREELYTLMRRDLGEPEADGGGSGLATKRRWRSRIRFWRKSAE